MASAAEAAGHIFLSPSRFRDLISTGVFERMPSGQYDLDVVRETYCRHCQRAMAGRGNDDGSKALSQQRAKLAEAQTRSAVLKTAILSGGYVSIEVVGRSLENMFGVMKETAMSTAGKVADAVSAHTKEDREAVFEIIDHEIREMLTTLSEPVLPSRPVAVVLDNVDEKEIA